MRILRIGERSARLSGRIGTGLAEFLLIVGGVIGHDAGAAGPAAPIQAEPMPAHQHVDSGIPDGDVSMRGIYGSYPMSRESSGTSWQPDSAPMEDLETMSGRWMTMFRGSLEGVYSHQGGHRGDSQSFNESMLMFMARRSIGDDAVGVRLMGSLEPLNGAGGYPLLFQTGETANGRDPLVDRQHPHNLVMEFAGSYSKSLTGGSSVFVYGGPVGEPALGPPAYMNRGSSEDNPDAPLTHHWLDATHVTFGVVTVGGIWRRWKLEGSSFNGREPDQHRYDVELRRLDSSSVRLSYNPNASLALQVSAGRLASPEQLQPNTAVRRTTASAIWDRSLGGARWQTTLAWGRDAPAGGRQTDGYLLDSALRLGRGHTVFARLEDVVKDELFALPGPLYGRPFRIRKGSLGYVFDFIERGHLRFSIGAVVSEHWTPADLNPAYGSDPAGSSLFVRARLVP